MSRERTETPGRERLARLVSGYRTAVDAWIPASLLEGDPELLRKARITVSLTYVLLLLGLETVVFFTRALQAEVAQPIGWALAAGMALTLLIPRALRRGAVTTASNLLLLASYGVILTVFVLVGGMHAPVLHWCGLLPMLSMLMGTRRSAFAWMAVSLATLGCLTAADVIGVELPNHLALEGSDRWIQRLVDVTSWILILFSVAVIYERHKDDRTAALGSTNAELRREVAQRRRAEERTHFLAYHDDLTQLPNREYFKNQLREAIAEARAQGRLVGVLFLDLDGFKEVNDTYGHGLGDLLLVHVARRLASCVRGVDAVTRGRAGSSTVVSRLGGDEFTVLLAGLREADEAAIVASRILRSLERPISLDGHELFISCSIGVALHPDDGDDIEGLLRNADLAMYHAKERGKRNYQFFEESLNEVAQRRTRVANDLRRGLAEDEFHLVYQPIATTRECDIVGVEALVRWRHPQRGLLGPVEFIEVAEETGLIVPLGAWIAREACRQIGVWRERGLPPLRLSINISGVQLRERSIVDTLRSALCEFGIAAKDVELEITEGAMMDDEEEASRVLAELKQLGAGIALDDFGTGYSSLSYVKRFPVDTVKIDRSFIGEVVEDPEARAITTAIIAMAHELNLRVVAEGVETEAQARFLRELSCDEFQGYLFSHPLEADELLGFLGTLED